MTHRRVARAVLLLAAGAATVAAGQRADTSKPPAPRPSLVVSTSWLADRLGDRNLVILHVGTRDDYAAAHIPGAQFVSPADVSAPSGQGLSLELPSADAAQAVLERCGVGNDSRIVIYSSQNQLAQAGRIFFTLDAFGLGEQASVLDGGLPAWRAEGREVTTDVRPPRPSALTLRPRATVVDFDWIVANGRKPGIVLVDARPAAQFAGAGPAARAPGAGHIPGAVNIPVSQLLADSGRLKPLAELAALFRSAGAAPADRIVAYCNTGNQSSAVYFIARYLGYDVVMYDGSMEDWNRRGGEVAVKAPDGDAGFTWVPQPSGTSVRFRGVSAVSATVAWAGGSNGTFARTADGGATWSVAVVPGAEDMDFRDVEAFDARTAYLLSVGAGARSRIYKTTDGGRSWALQFKNVDPDAFFDAMAFWDEQRGLAIGDPIDGRFAIVRTFDGGLTWIGLPPGNVPPALPGEAAFAASGTCLVTQGSDRAWFGTGGASQARVFRSTDRGFTWSVAATPVVAGTPSAGIFSLAFRNPETGVAVGGDYRKEDEPGGNLALTTDGGVTWSAPGEGRLRGFRSAVGYLAGSDPAWILAAGPTGSELSVDGGRAWTAIEGPGFHAISLAGAGVAGWGVGEAGRIARLAGVSSGSR